LNAVVRFVRINFSWFHKGIRKLHLKPTTAAELATPTLKRTASTVIILRTSLTHTQVSAVNGMTFQRGDSSLAFVTIAHSDEGKTTGFAAQAIGYNVNISDGAVR
jgi:hypothetical protein